MNCLTALRVGRTPCAGILLLGLSACGGGGGGGGGGSNPPPASISFSTLNVAFNAASPWAPTPANQNITATISGSPSGTLFIVVQVNNPEIASVTNVVVTGSNSGQATIVPVDPASLGAGAHQGTIVVRACMNDPLCNSGQLAGSPVTITVRYDVTSPIDADTVTPRVVDSNAAGTVILRGRGFTATATVAFGATNATATTFVSNTEIRASYPALAAGNHAIALNSGALAYNATLAVVDPPTFAAEFIPSPMPPAWPRTFIYDAERRALLLGVIVPDPGPPLPISQPILLRYAYVGGVWSSPTQVVVDNLRQVRLSHDGTKLLALRSAEMPVVTTSMAELDPVTLATGVSTEMPNLGQLAFGTSFALANDGNAMLSTAFPGSGNVFPVVYATTRRVFSAVPLMNTYFQSVASGDGSVVVIGTGGVTYNSSQGTFTDGPNGFTFSAFDAPPSASLAGRFQSGTGVYNAAQQLLGVAPGSQTAAVINREGTRLYTLDPAAQLRTFDLALPATGGGQFPEFVEVGTPIPLAGDPGTLSSPPPQMTITPDGRTVFIAGTNGVAIQPTP